MFYCNALGKLMKLSTQEIAKAVRLCFNGY